MNRQTQIMDVLSLYLNSYTERTKERYSIFIFIIGLVWFGILLLNTYSEHERFAVAFNAKDLLCCNIWGYFPQVRKLVPLSFYGWLILILKSRREYPRSQWDCKNQACNVELPLEKLNKNGMKRRSCFVSSCVPNTYFFEKSLPTFKLPPFNRDDE